MIRIFRTLRKELLSQGKLKSYMGYALGEVLLVVIGILIALQVNNWNEKRKDKALEDEYYCRILEDLKQDSEQINALIDFSKNRLKASNQAVRLLLGDKPKLVEVGEQNALAIKAIFTDFKPSNSAFEDLKSGSNLNIIQDKNVVKALNTYFNNIESIKSVIKINGENAVDIYYAHNDSFANGKTQASILSGRFQKGLEADIRDAIPIDTTAVLKEAMRSRLYNEALRYTSANTRQLELYNIIKDYNTSLQSILKKKCI